MSEADLIAAKTEALLDALQQQPASKFTLGELMWVQQLVTKMRWGTSLEFEQQLFEGVSELTKKIEEREGFNGKSTTSTQAPAGSGDAVAQRIQGESD